MSMSPPWPIHHDRWRANAGLRTALTCLFIVVAGFSAAGASASVYQFVTVGRYEQGRASWGDVQHVGRVISAIGGIGALPGLALIVVFIIWQWRSAKNGTIRMRYSPGWSIGGWFIPFANLVIPVRVMQDLWQSGDPDARDGTEWRQLPRSSLIGWWWTAFLAGYILDIGTGDSLTASQLRWLAAAHVVGHLLRLGAAVLALLLVQRITDRQDIARQRIPAPTVAGPPPGWYPDPIKHFDYRYWNGEAWTDHVSQAANVTLDPLWSVSAMPGGDIAGLPGEHRQADLRAGRTGSRAGQRAAALRPSGLGR
jgi:hypothetical protein